MAKVVPKSGWCCGISEKAIVCMVLICMIQGFIWSTLSVLLLALQTCALEFDFLRNIDIYNVTDKFTYVINLIYVAYLDGNCNPGSDGSPSVNVTMSLPFQRTYDLLVIHGFLNAVWIPICVLLMVAVLFKLRGCLVVTFLYCPWIIVTSCVLTFDLIAASMYFLDLNRARNLQDFVTFIRYKTYEDVPIPKSFQFDTYTLYAPLFFVLFFTRCILLTLFNVVTLFQILSFTIRICRNRKYAPSHGLLNDAYDDIYSPTIDPHLENIPLKMKYHQCHTDLQYESIGTPRPGVGPTQNGYIMGAHDYMDLLSYQTTSPVYQHIYEDIWRDVKKERLAYSGKTDCCPYSSSQGGDSGFSLGTPSSPVYDYLGTPLVEYDIDPKLLPNLVHIEAHVTRTEVSVNNTNAPGGKELKHRETPPALPAYRIKAIDDSKRKPSKSISSLSDISNRSLSTLPGVSNRTNMSNISSRVSSVSSCYEVINPYYERKYNLTQPSSDRDKALLDNDRKYLETIVTNCANAVTLCSSTDNSDSNRSKSHPNVESNQNKRTNTINMNDFDNIENIPHTIGNNKYSTNYNNDAYTISEIDEVSIGSTDISNNNKVTSNNNNTNCRNHTKVSFNNNIVVTPISDITPRNHTSNPIGKGSHTVCERTNKSERTIHFTNENDCDTMNKSHHNGNGDTVKTNHTHKPSKLHHEPIKKPARKSLPKLIITPAPLKSKAESIDQDFNMYGTYVAKL
uniref:Uncharacterized protein n=1 Tax=Cacopsylla melanoneura TaxID=428564 RepID=A0A8D8QWQ3_9HEMI